jgi:hypothetical protein
MNRLRCNDHAIGIGIPEECGRARAVWAKPVLT